MVWKGYICGISERVTSILYQTTQCSKFLLKLSHLKVSSSIPIKLSLKAYKASQADQIIYFYSFFRKKSQLYQSTDKNYSIYTYMLRIYRILTVNNCTLTIPAYSTLYIASQIMALPHTSVNYNRPFSSCMLLLLVYTFSWTPNPQAIHNFHITKITI